MAPEVAIGLAQSELSGFRSNKQFRTPGRRTAWSYCSAQEKVWDECIRREKAAAAEAAAQALLVLRLRRPRGAMRGAFLLDTKVMLGVWKSGCGDCISKKNTFT